MGEKEPRSTHHAVAVRCQRRSKSITNKIFLAGCAVLVFHALLGNLSVWNRGSNSLTSSRTGRHLMQEPTTHSSMTRTLPTNVTTEEPKKEYTDVGACLITMDDNHWLIEWLAYHYHALNLRRHVFVRDPLSMTSPNNNRPAAWAIT